jgi:mannose-6-phosphate isomerase-like protein (cupin superfamily)
VIDVRHSSRRQPGDTPATPEVIDVGAEAKAHEPWFNQTLTTVNDSVIRLGVLHGELHDRGSGCPRDDAEDEFFFVLEGQLLLDIENGPTITLDPHQGYTVPKGIVHRTRAPGRTVVLMVESRGVVPTGD